VASATLYFPTAESQQRINPQALHIQERRRRHAWSDPRKREVAASIAAAPRLSPRRAALFAEMHRDLRAAMAGEEYVRFGTSLDEQRQRADAQRGIFDRGLFYLIQPRNRLQKLIDTMREAFAS
jgi:hypothetical protein